MPVLSSSSCPPVQATTPAPTASTTITTSLVHAYTPNDYIIIDLILPSSATNVAIDTVRIGYTALAGQMLMATDFSAQLKQIELSDPTSSYFSDALFCRYSPDPTQLFFTQVRSNAWTASNLASINATLCAYATTPSRDRFMFKPATWAALTAIPITSAYLTATVTYTAWNTTSAALQYYTAAPARLYISSTTLPTQMINAPLIVASIVGLGVAGFAGFAATVSTASIANTWAGFAAMSALATCFPSVRKKLDLLKKGQEKRKE